MVKKKYIKGCNECFKIQKFNKPQGLVPEKWKIINLIRTNQGQINNCRYYYGS